MRALWVRQSLLMRLFLLLGLPASVIAWISKGFALGEGLLVVLLLVIWWILATDKEPQEGNSDVDEVLPNS